MMELEEHEGRRGRLDIREIGLPLGAVLACVIAVSMGVLEITDRIDANGKTIERAMTERIESVDAGQSALQVQLGALQAEIIREMGKLASRDDLRSLRTRVDTIYERQVEHGSRLRRLEDR